jgi:hypothetical protein
MMNKFPRITYALLLSAVLFSCKKNNGDKDETPGQFQSVTFRFGPDSTAINVDHNIQTIKNLPHSCDPKQMVAAPILPAGFSISPDAATAKDYTKGVSYTVTNSSGQAFTIQITALVYDAVSNPYGVYTAKHLNDIRNGLNDSYVMMNDIQLPDLTATNAAITTGISDYRNYGWFSIGSRYVNGGNVTFRGSFDGQNHVVKNFTSTYRGSNFPNGIDAGHDSKASDGLFGYAVKASIKNIGIQLAATGINDFASASTGYEDVGALLGMGDSCTITGCYVTGNAAITGVQKIGGLIGDIQNSTVTKSYAALSSVAGSYLVSAGSIAGGLIGRAFNSEITDSYASASVISTVDVGGLVGSANTVIIKTSYASGNVAETPMNGSNSLTAPNNLGGLVGGLASTTSSTIQNCYATGAVTGANGSNSDFHKTTKIGGLIGQISSSSGPVSITNCYAAGVVSRVWINATAPFLIGGLVGNTQNGVFITSAVCTNYWDKTNTGQPNLGGANPSFAQDNGFTANGKTSSEMKANATYSNWDFSSVWNMTSGTNNGYPYLRTVIK